MTSTRDSLSSYPAQHSVDRLVARPDDEQRGDHRERRGGRRQGISRKSSVQRFEVAARCDGEFHYPKMARILCQERLSAVRARRMNERSDISLIAEVGLLTRLTTDRRASDRAFP